MRKISMSLYVVAFIVSVIIFLLGFYVGDIFYSSRIDDFSLDIRFLSDDLYATQMIMILDDNSTSFCPLYLEELEKVDKRVQKLGEELTVLEEVQGVSDAELKKRYFLLETQAYLLSTELNKRCNKDVKIILYFYSGDNCESCKQQGFDLTKARETLAKDLSLKIYSFDSSLGSSSVDSFIKKYHISKYPTIVLEERVYSGYQNFDTLVTLFSS